MGKGDKRRQRRRERARGAAQVATHRAQRESLTAPPQPHHGPVVRPTPEREARGKWADRHSRGRSGAINLDLHHDQIAQLADAGEIDAAQAQAARDWQELRAAYLRELPEVRGYLSCLAGGEHGHDDSDGDPAVLARYREIEARMSRRMLAELMAVCEHDQPPRSIVLLRAALDAVAA